MASGSSSSRPIDTPTISYDVFLSFRGEDTRYTFTDHLYKALLQAKLSTFRGKDTIQLGHKLKPEIKDAIIGSRASIVVLSENYASSRWCLDELCLILEQKRKRHHFVLPVFYRVDPSAVKEGRSFTIQGSNWTEDNVKMWNEALREVADLKGMILSGYKTFETDFIKEVVETVNNQLNLKQPTPAHLTGMATVNRQLDFKQMSDPAHLIGMGTVNRQLDFRALNVGLLSMRNLVVLDMSYVGMEEFEIPMVLNSLKILYLKECHKLVSICNLNRLPKLEELILCNCSSLIHLCKSIEELESLVLLDLKGCTKLLKASSNKRNVKSSPKHPRIDGGNAEQPLFSLPCSLKSLYLDFCEIEYSNDVQVAFHAQSFISLCLGCNIFKFLPNGIDLKMLRALDLYYCPNLKSLTCIPSKLEELYVDGCKSLESIAFESGRFSLEQFSYEGCFKLSEIEGLFKLVPIAKLDEGDLVQHMQWIKEYEDNEVDLVGDDITKGRDRQAQMLYEYGITSTYLQGINDQIMTRYKYISSSSVLSFFVPLRHEKNRIRGLSVSCLYRFSGSKDNDELALLAKISNRSKGLTWVYNPVVYGKPRVDEDVVWVSYWPIGNVLDAGDEVSVDIIVYGVIVIKCGANLMDGEVEEENNYESKTMKGAEVIGGDLSEFEVTPGCYYLCRRDLFGSANSSRLQWLFDDNIYCPKWRKTHQSWMRNVSGSPVIHENLHFLPCKYDVFLSFRGEDTRHTFTNHLYNALDKAGLHTFRDNDEINKGQLLKPDIESAITESEVFIVVLSQNYANSRWCLNELCLIMEQRRRRGHFVLPVFYHVDPSDVRNQRGSFAIEGSNWTVNDVTRWKAALTEVANLTGLAFSESPEAIIIKEVVAIIYHKLGSKQTLDDHSFYEIHRPLPK